MTLEETKTTLPSLHKYMRRRRLLSKSGFYLEIKGNGEVSATRDESSVYSSLLFLSVGPNFVAIVGEQAKRYLAVDQKGKVFTTMSERKECVFREFLGRNFFSLFRTCHSDSKGRGWYLSLNDLGKIRAEKVSYSDEPQLHFLVQVAKEKQDDKSATQTDKIKEPFIKLEDKPVWIRRSRESLSRSSSLSPTTSKSGRSGSASSASSISGLSEYGSPVGFLYERDPGFNSPVSLSGRSEYDSPLPFPRNSGLTSPVSVSGLSEYGSPLPFPQNSGLKSPVSVSGRSEYGSPLPFSQNTGLTSPVSVSGRSEYGSPLPFSQKSGSKSPVRLPGQSTSGSTTSSALVSHRSSQTSPVNVSRQSCQGSSPESSSSRSDSSFSSKESVRFGKIYRNTPC